MAAQQLVREDPEVVQGRVIVHEHPPAAREDQAFQVQLLPRLPELEKP